MNPESFLSNFRGSCQNFQLFLITLPVLVNILKSVLLCLRESKRRLGNVYSNRFDSRNTRLLLPLPSANLGCARCVCKQAFTHSLARAFAPKKAVTESTAVHFNHQCLKCKQWHIAHRLLEA